MTSQTTLYVAVSFGTIIGMLFQQLFPGKTDFGTGLTDGMQRLLKLFTLAFAWPLIAIFGIGIWLEMRITDHLAESPWLLTSWWFRIIRWIGVLLLILAAVWLAIITDLN